MKATQQVECNTAEGFSTMEEIVDNRPTCNDIFWDEEGWPDSLPLYINVKETEGSITQ